MTDQDTIRLEGKVDSAAAVLNELKGMLGAVLPGLQIELNDHEKRIRSLERWRFAFPSLAVLGLLVSVAVLVVYILSLHR